MRALKTTPFADEVSKVSQALHALFGMGAGRIILRSVGDLVGEPAKRVAQVSGVRKIVHLSRHAASFAHDFGGQHFLLTARRLGLGGGASPAGEARDGFDLGGLASV